MKPNLARNATSAMIGAESFRSVAQSVRPDAARLDRLVVAVLGRRLHRLRYWPPGEGPRGRNVASRSDRAVPRDGVPAARVAPPPAGSASPPSMPVRLGAGGPGAAAESGPPAIGLPAPPSIAGPEIAEREDAPSVTRRAGL